MLHVPTQSTRRVLQNNSLLLVLYNKVSFAANEHSAIPSHTLFSELSVNSYDRFLFLYYHSDQSIFPSVADNMSRLLSSLRWPSAFSVVGQHTCIQPATWTRATSSWVSKIPEGATQNSQAKEWLVIIPDQEGVVCFTETAL